MSASKINSRESGAAVFRVFLQFFQDQINSRNSSALCVRRDGKKLTANEIHEAPGNGINIFQDREDV